MITRYRLKSILENINENRGIQGSQITRGGLFKKSEIPVGSHFFVALPFVNGTRQGSYLGCFGRSDPVFLIKKDFSRIENFFSCVKNLLNDLFNRILVKGNTTGY